MCVTLRSWDYDSWYSHVWTCQVTMNERWTHWLITSRMFLVNWFRRTETCRRPRASSSRARTVCFNSSSHCRACISRSSWVCLCISEPATEQTSSRAMRGKQTTESDDLWLWGSIYKFSPKIILELFLRKICRSFPSIPLWVLFARIEQFAERQFLKSIKFRKYRNDRHCETSRSERAVMR